jgi:hypothetical protein
VKPSIDGRLLNAPGDGRGARKIDLDERGDVVGLI